MIVVAPARGLNSFRPKPFRASLGHAAAHTALDDMPGRGRYVGTLALWDRHRPPRGHPDLIAAGFGSL
ncbi:hypothetical protein [Nocardia aurantia]|uniref:Uncharacterized protein n=1 Tax=Nocardia aurantia TaxID=2585199 RepID=A0A7K0DL62_9NOCA|nr:hypothetical protein [Nocardia aurantia]MQY26525.1 hypothetical protein [Nocardia aurantia]